MNKKILARIAVCRCNQKEQIYGVRMENRGNKWVYNWAFKLKPDTAEREKYGETSAVEGMLVKDEDYPGCPYCRAQYFIVCGGCGRLSCNNSNGSNFKCGWCGMEGELTNYTGDGFRAGGDR